MIAIAKRLHISPFLIWVTVLGIFLAAGMAGPAFVYAQQSTVVVCQKKKNAQKIKLRPDACKPKENLILNLTEALTTTDSRLTVIESYLGVPGVLLSD